MGVQVNIVGIVGKACEVRQSRNGNKFATFILGTKTFHNGVEEMAWFSVIDNSPHVVNVLAPLLKKGSLINVIGEEFVKLNTYNGETRILREIIASNTMLIHYPRKKTEDTKKEKEKEDQALAMVMKQIEQME